jgi:tetratricopeptide (TPR) repeat protein
MLSHQAIDKKATYDIGLLEPMLKMVEEKSMLDEVGVAVYYYGYRAITDRNEPAHFENLTRILNEHSASFPKPELRELYLLSINYCVSRINIGQEIFFSKAFDLYRKGFDLEVLVDEQDIVSKFIFTNTVYSAIKTKNYEWAESFIEKFSSRLEDKHRHSTVQFNLSRLYYERNDYDKAQILLREFEYDDMLMNVVAKIMLLKIYYKTGEYDALESLIEAVRSYLQRKEAMSQSHKNVFKNIILLMKKLLHLNTYSKPQVEKFRKAVMETNPIQEQEREWFLQQINGK